MNVSRAHSWARVRSAAKAVLQSLYTEDWRQRVFSPSSLLHASMQCTCIGKLLQICLFLERKNDEQRETLHRPTANPGCCCGESAGSGVERACPAATRCRACCSDGTAAGSGSIASARSSSGVSGKSAAFRADSCGIPVAADSSCRRSGSARCACIRCDPAGPAASSCRAARAGHRAYDDGC